MQIFTDNRINNLNEWFDLCEYLKITTNLEVLRSIFLSSLTIGIPQYAIEIKENTLSLIRIKQEDLETYMNKIEYSEIKKARSRTRITESSVLKSFRSSKQDLGVDKKNQGGILSSRSGSVLSQLNKDSVYMTEFYEPLVDTLLDLVELVDLSLTRNGDSTNILLINRTIILVDLMKHLNDKNFQENYSFSLCQIVHSIVTQVFSLNPQYLIVFCVYHCFF